MRGAFVLVLLVPAVARAQPGLEPPVEIEPPFVPHMEAAARAGLGWGLIPGGIADRSGSGPYFDLEVGRRLNRELAISGFVSYLTIGAPATDADFGYETDWTRDRLIDVGARVSYHFYGEDGPFIGAGVGMEFDRSSGIDQCSNASNGTCTDPSGRMSASYYEPFNDWTHDPFGELHAGVTLPKIDVLAIQLLAIVSYGPAITGRIAAGVAF